MTRHTYSPNDIELTFNGVPVSGHIDGTFIEVDREPADLKILMPERDAANLRVGDALTLSDSAGVQTHHRIRGMRHNFGGTITLTLVASSARQSARERAMQLHPWATMPSIHRARPLRLHGRELARKIIGDLAETYTADTPGNRHCARRWLNAAYGPFLVANDALLAGDRAAAIGVLVWIMSLDDAIRLTAPPIDGDDRFYVKARTKRRAVRRSRPKFPQKRIDALVAAAANFDPAQHIGYPRTSGDDRADALAYILHGVRPLHDP